MTAPPIRALLDPWPARDRVVVLQIGFGNGAAFLEAWQHWRDDALRCVRLDVICIDPAPPDVQRLAELLRATDHGAPASELLASWPPITPGLHRLAFDHARVQLLLAVGEVAPMLRQIDAQVHVFLAGSDAEADPRHRAKALARLAAPGARLLLTPGTPSLDALRPVGFVPGAADAEPRHAVYAPTFAARHRAWRAPASDRRHAVIVGAGLAGCALACALAEQGWDSTLIDRHDAPAQEGSSNPAGLFHGIVNVQDGAHARFNRAAAVQARLAVRRAIDEHGAHGSTDGLLRLETAGADVGRMQAVLARLRLDPRYVRSVDAVEAGRLCGLPLEHPAWFYPGGGWVQPAALARSYLERAASACHYRGRVEVHSLQRRSSDWQLLDKAGRTLGEAATLVLANAFDAQRLLGLSDILGIGGWPMQRLRGQISLASLSAAPWRLPSLPLAGAGYLLPAIGGQAIFGASVGLDDSDDAAPQDADHRFNLQRLRRLSPQTLPGDTAFESLRLSGRVGWRCAMPDRLPLAGAVPDESAGSRAHATSPHCPSPTGAWPGDARTWGRPAVALRDLPRLPGLYVFSALGSRGIAWSSLGAQILAAQIAGAPLPVDASLRDAIDPGRFALRRARRPHGAR